MLHIQFLVDKEKVRGKWFLKYHEKPEERILIETENFCREIEDKWKAKETLVSSAFKKITGIELRGEFIVFVFHPDLEMAEYLDARTIEWGYKEFYPNYLVIGIAHELLHCITHDFYTKLTDDEKWIFHSLVYLAIDEDLRFLLNGKAEYFSSSIIYTYHRKLIVTAKNILPKWEEYTANTNSKNIIDLYRELSF